MFHYWNPTSCEPPALGDTVHGAVVGVLEDGTVVQLGFASGLTVTSGTNSVFISGTYETTVSCSGSSGSAESDVVDEAADFGDANRSGSVTWMDRQAWIGTFGLGINQFGYTPRLDFDLDGDLDINDLNAFNARYCPADVDDGTATGTWDGGVTNDDLLYFLDVFELGTPQADLDDGSGTGLPDGGVTNDDLLFFLDRFELGC